MIKDGDYVKYTHIDLTDGAVTVATGKQVVGYAQVEAVSYDGERLSSIKLSDRDYWIEDFREFKFEPCSAFEYMTYSYSKAMRNSLEAMMGGLR